MAVYGVSYYGLSKYGADVLTEFDVTPVTATPADYSSVIVDWQSPAGTWDELRLIRNRYGWAINENDGEILLDVTHAANSFVDTGVVGGHWLYYTIFIHANGSWSRAGTASALMPKDNGYADMMYSLIPEYYRVDVASGNAVTDSENTLNPYIKPFLSIFAFGFDMVKSYYDSNRYTHDAMRTRYGNIELLAQEFGIDYEASAPAYLFRQRVRDAATLGRQKGTLEQIRSLISETVGWDTDLSIGPNLMLSDDQAGFNHPSYPEWDPSVNYAAGERAKFGSYLYQANTGGAYGQAQVPTGTSSGNTYWSVVTLGTDTTLQNANGNIAGWEEVSYTTGVTPGTSAVVVGVGAQSPTNPSDQAGNALVVKNNNSGNQVATMGVRSVARLSGQSTMDPQQPVLWGIPIPYNIPAWSSTVYYQPGDMVAYHGRNYRALSANINTQPPDTAATGYGTGGYGQAPYGGVTPWQALGYDDRFQLCLSGYTQAWTGGTVAVYPYVEFYDCNGLLITTLSTDALPAYTVLDSFTQNWTTWNGRTTDVGGLTWTVNAGTWTSGGFDGGVAYPTNTGRALASLTGHADGSVSVTFDTSPTPGLKQGAVFRMQDSSNYWRAGRTALYRIAAGAVAATYNYTKTFNDGDRMTVSYSGSNIAVLCNGTQVLSITDTNLQTATGVGMVTE